MGYGGLGYDRVKQQLFFEDFHLTSHCYKIDGRTRIAPMHDKVFYVQWHLCYQQAFAELSESIVRRIK